MTLNGFTQIVNSPSHITKETSTMIDHIFVNKPSFFPTVCVASTSLSDHELVFCRRKINTIKFSYRTIKCRDYAKYNPNELKNDVR